LFLKMIYREKGGEMEGPFSRTELLLGAEGVEKLRRATVAVFGIGGVGGYVVEALARSGVGRLHLIDHDTVSVSNLNRQIIATVNTIGRYKVDAAKERVMEINPEAEVCTHKTFYMPETEEEFDFTGFDYVVDAIDTVTGKLALIMQAERAGVPVISSMGAGNKLDASAFEVADIYQTSVCPLAKVMRRELKKRGVRKLKVVYSKEQPVTNSRPPGSNAFVPAAAGLILAGEVVKDLAGAGKERILP
jgi:tRNA A37 threonylcarbamoyladenosine dehydratase